jgi:ABC-type oligopeptide transport system ATPase subunit
VETMKPNEQQFIEELQQILHQLQVTHETTFKQLYIQLQPTFQELQTKYELTENPTGTNTTLIMYLTVQHNRWYEQQIYNKPYHDPTQLLIDGLEKLFTNNTKYTHNGKTFYYWKGRNTIPKIKRDIIQEFEHLLNNPHPYKIRYVLRQVEHRFT